MRDTKAGFKRPPDFSITEHLGDSFGVFKAPGRRRIRIRFDAFAARLVGERQWHPSQKLRQLADGEIELALELGGLEEIERWILSWGAHAVVLEPKALIDAIRGVIGALARSYGP